MKKILILGCSGSIGTSTVKIIREYRDLFQIVGLTVNNSKEQLNRLIKEFNIKNYGVNSEHFVSIDNKSFNNIEDVNTLLAKELDYDIVINALVGSLGFFPTAEAIKRNKIIALANKETIVAFGTIIEQLLKEYNKARIYPVDSEHSALWQLLENRDVNTIESITITASGGVLFNNNKDNITVEDILKHPIWDMGQKVTVDSSTMINKGLEIIEAHYLFNLPSNKIKVLIHPQSIVHGIVNFKDGTSIAHMAMPNMILPIEYALFYPNRPNKRLIANLDLDKLKNLTFYNIDFNKYRGLAIAYECLEKGFTYPAVFSAANEVAVNRFLKGDIDFHSIVKIVDNVVKEHKPIEDITIQSIIESENKAKQMAMNLEVK